MLNFKKLRSEKNLTQKEFSLLTGISGRSLSNYENGNLNITLKKLQEIATLISVDFFELFENNPQPVVSNKENLDHKISYLEEQVRFYKEKAGYLDQKLQECEQEKKRIQTIS